MEKKTKFGNRWSVFKENNPTAHICVLIIAVNVAFILLSTAIISILPENQGKSISEIIRLAFTLMVNPSGKYIYSEAPISLILTTVVVLLGMISLTGGTVGFVTSVINSILEKRARNQQTLKLEDHIVILNYNQRVPSILCDYCFDDMKSTFIVILTDKDKNVVNQQIDEMYNQAGMKQRFKNVIVRSGNPMSALDLERIAIEKAQTVLIMAPEDEQGTSAAGFAVSKLFLFVTSYLRNLKQESTTDIVVETSDHNMDMMVREYNVGDESRDIIAVQPNLVIGKILGVTAVMPTVNDVLKQLFSFEGTEIYTRPIPAESIVEELERSRSVMPLFDINGKRVYIAEDEAEFDKKNEAGYQLKKPLPSGKFDPKFIFSKSNIIIIGINEKLDFVLESLVCFREEYNNSNLHVILADAEDKRTEMEAYYADPRYTDILQSDIRKPIIIRNIYRPMDELASIVNGTADTVLFLSDENVSGANIDEKPLLYWSDIKGRMSSEVNPDIVVEIRNSENQRIIRDKNKDQILVSDDFLGHLYAQLGKNPMRLSVIMDMITSEGDTGSVNDQNETENSGDLLCLKNSILFENANCDLTFTSKRELILWTYRATGGKILPVGIARNGIAYLFSRTESSNDGLDSCVLLGIHEGEHLPGSSDRIKLEPDDELIAFVFS